MLCQNKKMMKEINPRNYKTRTIFQARCNPSVPGIWTEAIDFGYSSVKGFSPNSIFCFPSYAHKVDGVRLDISSPSPSDIQYRDENGEIWNVGDLAYAMTTSSDTADSEKAMFGRNRYYDPMFLVVVRTGLGCGMTANKICAPSGKLVLQTGLPPRYIKGDHEILKQAISGHHVFDLKFGAGAWQHYDFILDMESIKIMPQPMGAIMSIATSDSAMLLPEAKSYFSSNVLVLDPGFGTADFFDVRKGQVLGFGETDDHLGMKEVFLHVIDKVYKTYGVEYQIAQMQQCLGSGNIKIFDRRNMRTTSQPIAPFLMEASEEICMQMIQRVRQLYNDLVDHDYLVIAGGTGDAWFNLLTEYLSGMETLQVLNAAKNSDLPNIFSVVRGYYNYLINSLMRSHKPSPETR